MLISIQEIDLARNIPALYVGARYGRTLIVVRRGYQPLGLLQLPGGPQLFDRKRLGREISRRLGWEIWERTVNDSLRPAEGAAPLPPISVVVCTRDQPHFLSRCLERLSSLDYPEFEVVVVDNRARNAGVRQARHGIVAFIDDDVVASHGWLRGVARGFEDRRVMAVTGMVIPAEIEIEAQDDFERCGGMSKGCCPFEIQRDELPGQTRFWASNWGTGTNMAFRRELFDRVGLFDPALDVGRPGCGAGDIEFLYRTVSGGHTLRYEPAAMVRHGACLPRPADVH